MARKTPAQRAEAALKALLTQREALQKKLTELDGVIAGLGQVIGGRKLLPVVTERGTSAIVRPIGPAQEPIPVGPETELADEDQLGAGRWI